MSNKLISGNQYTLKDLFKEERKIIIPDLQRDYCWGDKKHGKGKDELVTGFVSGLIDLFKNNEYKEHQLGMIYAYENPINHIQLCDGQQRITTLYLLLGVLHRCLDGDVKKRVQSVLISYFELNDDDKEPHLQYAIRESTLYFLSDLVCKFFLNEKLDTKDIKKQNWYFSDYNHDPTIQSMLSAIEIIEGLVKSKDEFKHDGFAGFLLNNIKFFYFDMKTRQHGEEMFVIINTTGEPLTATENLKPILIGNIVDKEEREKSSEMWEKWETWFWHNKLKDEHEADDGLNQFFIWYWQVKLKQESDWTGGEQRSLNPIKLFKNWPTRKNDSSENEYSTISEDDWKKAKSFKEINKYFEQYCKLYDYFKEDRFLKVLQSVNKKATCPRLFTNTQQLRIVLPMLEFMVKYHNDDTELHRLFLRRLRKNYYDGEWEERNNNSIDWRHIIQIIEFSKNEEDVLQYHTIKNKDTFKNISKVTLNEWYNEEEQVKTELKKDDNELIEYSGV